nr:tetratricopeptide repeat protein [Coleofasciculus sp. FACHB-129]
MKFLAGETDKSIAQSLGIEASTARKHIQEICNAFGLKNQPGERYSLRSELIKLFRRHKPELVSQATLELSPEVESPEMVSGQNKTATLISHDYSSHPDPNFMGREDAISHLNIRVNQGAKVIVIQAPGGVGKTTLAQQYLKKTQGFDLVLELLMAKEKENITAVESVIEEWLKQDFQEEPGREFGVTLGRLKRQLQTRRVGVLIDNLEPALDKQGKFIEPHRRYVELLRVLADSTVQSVTLITSREPLGECVDVASYSLPRLNEQAWQEFFSSRNIDTDDTALREMHKAYDGNALAMKVLCDPIHTDGGMAAYWREHKVEADLLVELAVENLIKDQFNRLEEIYPEAYRLLCRLGCYRYQDVPTIPTEGLLCVLWDVPEVQRRRIIESLRNRCLIECQKGKYLLHPVIRAEAIARLRKSEDWEIANCKAAEFWTESVKTVETIEDALKAFEAYYHYLEIQDFEQAATVFIKRINNRWNYNQFLGRSLYMLGLSQKLTLVIPILNNIKNSKVLGKIYELLGDRYWIEGETKRAINYYINSQDFAIKAQDKKLELIALLNLGLCKIGLWEIEEASSYFADVEIQCNQYSIYEELVWSWFCLAFVKSCLALKQEAYEWADKVDNEITKGSTLWNHCDTWVTGYSHLFLGSTYNNLGDMRKSFEMYTKTLHFADESDYPQLRAKALNGLAEIYREQEDFDTALLNHLESIELLEKIGAKCDLAEAYYQLALTYQKMGKNEKSQANFDEAIRLFDKMKAPKQVEKVRRAIASYE